MEEKKINFNVTSQNGEPVVLKIIETQEAAKATPQIKPITFSDTVFDDFPEVVKRMVANGQLDPKKAIIIIDVVAGVVSLLTDDTDKAHKFEAKIVLNPDLVKLGINSNRTLTNAQFVSLIKWYGSSFTDEGVFRKLLADYMKFSGTVTSIRDSQLNNGSGQVKDSLAISVDLQNSAITRAFGLSIPVLRGGKKVVVPVEIGFDGTEGEVMIFLESIPLKEMLDKVNQDLVEEVKTKLREQEFTVFVK